MTGNPESTLAKNAHYHLNVNVTREACPMNLAPTSSTTAMLVMGDALAIALIRERNFRPEDYAVFHPGGSLGRRLLTRVRDVMRKDIPCVEPTATLGDVIIRISDARLGIAAIVEQGRLTGVITDGDVRRAMTKYKENFFNIEARQIMSRSPKTVSPDARITEAEEMMRTHKIHSDRRDRRERRAGRRPWSSSTCRCSVDSCRRGRAGGLFGRVQKLRSFVA